MASEDQGSSIIPKAIAQCLKRSQEKQYCLKKSFDAFLKITPDIVSISSECEDEVSLNSSSIIKSDVQEMQYQVEDTSSEALKEIGNCSQNNFQPVMFSSNSPDFSHEKLDQHGICSKLSSPQGNAVLDFANSQLALFQEAPEDLKVDPYQAESIDHVHQECDIKSSRIYLKKGSGSSRYGMKRMIGFKKTVASGMTSNIHGTRLKDINHKEKHVSQSNVLKIDPFEVLEALVEQESFCSTSSKVTRLMNDADQSLCSTPIHSKSPCRNRLTLTPILHQEKAQMIGPKKRMLPASSLYPGILKNCLRLQSIGGKNDSQSLSPKVHFHEQGVEVLEYAGEDHSNMSFDTSSYLNDSDLVTLYDLEEIVSQKISDACLGTAANENIDTENISLNFKDKRSVESSQNCKMPLHEIVGTQATKGNVKNDNSCDQATKAKNENVDIEALKLLLLAKVNELNKEIDSFKHKNNTLDDSVKNLEKEKQELISQQLIFSCKNSKANPNPLQKEKKDKHTHKVKSLEEKNTKLDIENKSLKATVAKLEREKKVKRFKPKMISNVKIQSNNHVQSKELPSNSETMPLLNKDTKSLNSNNIVVKKGVPSSRTETELEKKFPTEQKSSLEFHLAKKVHFQTVPESTGHQVYSLNNECDSSDDKENVATDLQHTPYKLDSYPNVNEVSEPSQLPYIRRAPHEQISRENTLQDSRASNKPQCKDSCNDEEIKEMEYYNGNRKISYPNNVTLYNYSDGSKKTVYPDKTIYFYSEDNITHVKSNDGKEVIHFPNGQRETYHTNGSQQIIFPDNSSQTVQKDGTKICVLSDGTVITNNVDGIKTIESSNGQKEIYYKDETHRVWPDGTVKILHADGKLETRYANGRTRIKDKEGNVVMKW